MTFKNQHTVHFSLSGLTSHNPCKWATKGGEVIIIIIIIILILINIIVIIIIIIYTDILNRVIRKSLTGDKSIMIIIKVLVLFIIIIIINTTIIIIIYGSHDTLIDWCNYSFSCTNRKHCIIGKQKRRRSARAERFSDSTFPSVPHMTCGWLPVR